MGGDWLIYIVGGKKGRRGRGEKKKKKKKKKIIETKPFLFALCSFLSREEREKKIF